MEQSKSAKQQLLEIAGEKLLGKLKEYKEKKNKDGDSSSQKLLDEVEGSELVSKPEEMMTKKSPSKEMVRYHSVVELDDFEDDFNSCADSVDSRQRLKEFDDSGKNGDPRFEPLRTEKPVASLADSSPYCSSKPKPEGQSSELSNFVQKKSIAQGMMDLALVSANTNQLRYVMDIGENHPYFFTSMALIITSLVMQLIVGLALIYNSRFNIRKKSEMRSADRINDISVIGVFLITLINVFISTFNGSNSGPYSGEVIPMSSDVTSPVPDVGSSLNASSLNDAGV